MRENILDKEQSQDLRVYAVWLNQRVTDERGAIDESILADPRVTQYWDGEGITGTHFADTDLGGLGYSGFVYDVFYVFGPDAAWLDDPRRSPAPAGRCSTRATSSSLRCGLSCKPLGGGPTLQGSSRDRDPLLRMSILRYE